MKKIYLLVVLSLIVLLSSCQDDADVVETVDGYDIIIIDTCEYIEVKFFLGGSQGYYSLTHKGNCKHCTSK